LMMPSNLLLWGGAVVLCSMASPILCFSHGASLTSCQEMIPGHIRAHPLDPKHSFITLQTSSSSYLPGQLITVTVRSSRDFMGFLLQARSVGGQRVGGSWIRSPPGTHTLRCLFEGDTVTHSDKQLKRNLSFVWRAPDMPKGDIRFHITVVQSYFVYWTGVESAVVRD
uniref:Reelin domain-containing protein n=1 Tax=Poecilia formosa TaxID=48698 RepID=A0A087YJK5_POEFO